MLGWQNPQGDKYFRVQRREADECDERTAIFFYKLMMKIAEELHQSTTALTIQQAYPCPINILDMCMAPGGFLKTALNKNPGSRALAFSLPIKCGGHRSRLPKIPSVEQRFLDITLLATDMGVEQIPQGHSDAKNFLPRQFESNQLFELAICDGQVLRKHERAAYREVREARRLTVTQLSLGLQFLRPGGTMILLLHKLEAWDTVTLVYTFSEFSSVQLFKPKSGHAKRSSFYMVATGIQSQSDKALRAINRWKRIWRVATFGSDDEYREELRKEDLQVETVIERFGQELVALGNEIWKVQANALKKAPFIKSIV
ncbi:unnamed protein product [Penicillium salamii]|uniref:Ribosomal RNA methyltransferase FtsJ domain-containing protein n=1 Tax=Penicillium salamii TaxID=1612424 RepID=A0A9W4NF19_9EURO|nr:unnamed protein product [Penicillium salamii]CAG8031908.1 unnamed protein product [Penicillium salamii]CAG8055993.1 unnamed protein product [Penicillium salamii]CAG8056890.1 unnamed protein product [Penicillium salamii]CAG8076616.1 unnamed protein product [Penicillium salamii]